ncbi:MAG: RIP metalloprotease RseP [Firmicutes bacterium]|nr:RIP metalloprotease RseP [Bacillota bacterium]
MGFVTAMYALLVFCVLIMVHELGHFFAAKLTGVQVNELSLGMGPKLFEHQGKETLYTLRLLPIGGFCAMEGEDEESENERAFNNKPAISRALIIVAGAVMNVLLAVVILSAIAGYTGIASTELDSVTEGKPAYQAGIRPGDEIIEINGEKVNFFVEVRNQIRQSEDTVELVLRRGDQKVYASIPVEIGEDGYPIIGIVAKVTKNPLTAIHYGAVATVDMGKSMVGFIAQLFTGQSSVNELTGPVGIVSAIGQQAKHGFIYVANLAALISLNLGIMNMLPLPALDGGRLLFIIINGITGKAVSEELEGKIHMAGMLLLFGLMAYVLLQDVGRLMG